MFGDRREIFLIGSIARLKPNGFPILVGIKGSGTSLIPTVF